MRSWAAQFRKAEQTFGDGYALAARPEIGAVVLDLAMPVMSGEQALPHLLQLRPALPILVSSGYSEAEVRRRFKTAGVKSFIQKPFQSAILVQAVNACLERG